MAIKTENLAIMLTDIVGYTKATMEQSRSENEQLLATHNRILLPIMRQFRGRHIKSIGDALLLVFRSPTDAMLCAMAMQDALYEYNRSAPETPIHIRIAASLGEVRVTRNDIFGEPVNLTSRIEGITPSDEIYLSEALYMAMNKAEVPAQEVGWKELKGISQPVRIYNIPRFAPSRLVPEAMSTEDLGELVYPFGGAHLNISEKNSSALTQLRQIRRRFKTLYTPRVTRATLIGLLVLPLAVFGVLYIIEQLKPAPINAETTPAEVIAQAPEPIRQPAQKPPAVEEKITAPVVKPVTSQTPTAAKKTATQTPKPAVAQTAKPAQITKPAQQPSYNNVSSAKAAYRAGKIDRAEYGRIIDSLKADYRVEVGKAKEDYRAGRISREEYRERVRKLRDDLGGD